jgi:hypothetical protein
MAMAAGAWAAPLTTAVTFQGQLRSDGVPINAPADLHFTLWDAAAGGNSDADVQIKTEVPVVNGLFTVELDFGHGAFEGSMRWIEIGVRYPAARGGAFTRLTPRQTIVAVPYAVYALDSPGSGGAGGTLNDAYDSGGPGLGRTITADAGPVNIAGPDGMTINGPVGVGTESPQWELDVFDADVDSGFPTTEPFDTRFGVRHDLNTFGVGWTHRWLYLRAGSDAAISRNQGSDLRFNREYQLDSKPLTQMILTDDGRLGIGTTNPKQRLHVAGDYYGRGHLYLHSYDGDGQDGYAYIQARDDSGSSTISLRLRAQSAGVVSDVMTLQHTGQVGVGTIGPNARLHVFTGAETESNSFGGTLVVGGQTLYQLSMDGNEIMARHNGGISELYLNEEGGDVVTGGGIVAGGDVVVSGTLDIGYEIVSSTENDTVLVDVACPAGKRVIGGGCRAPFGNSVVETFALSSSTWRCVFADNAGSMEAQAICAKVR